MPAIDERLERIEHILDKSGLQLLADLETGNIVSENLGLLMEPKNLRLLSLLARFTEQADALEKLVATLEKLDRSGALELVGDVAENLSDSLGLIMEPRNLRLFAHLANFLDALIEIDPTVVGRAMVAAKEAVAETLTPEKLQRPPRVGALGLVKALADPEVEEGLGLLVELLRVLSRTMKRLA